ncbi:MAG: aminopeptidase P N-terminal domain-containing protein [Bacteroidales bacterium]|nr:aminopeptidase P N-terminal domain-containing protein [Bacteroidales bacterium]
MHSLPASFFIKSRSKLMELLLPGSIVIISSSRSMPRNGDQFFPFRQSSDFYYLTGIGHESCTLIIYPDFSKGLSFREMLLIPEQSEKNIRWEGPGISEEQAALASGISDVRRNTGIKTLLQDLVPNCRYVYFGTPAKNGNELFSNEGNIRNGFFYLFKHVQEHQLKPLTTRIRMKKEPEEIEMIKNAVKITRDAFMKLLKAVQPGFYEYEIAAVITYEFNRRGAAHHAFEPIVASGKNALVLHYVKNNSICNADDLLLLDFGAEWNCYAADVSRTIPVKGRYSKRQRVLYEANLRVLEKAMEMMRPGILLHEYNETVGMLWQEEHIGLGLYSPGDAKRQMKIDPLWKKFFWHNTSHALGMDVHDPFDRSVRLQSGMVLTCEPGIYISEEGVGIRIENDILITEDGPVNLTADIPVDPGEIETLMSRAK